MAFGLRKTLCGIVLGLGLTLGATTFSGCGDTYNTRNYYYTNSQEEDVGKYEQPDLLVMDVKSEDIHSQLEDQGAVQDIPSSQDADLEEILYNCNGQNIRVQDITTRVNRADLSNYPVPFDSIHTIFVVGANAPAEDAFVVQDIMDGLPRIVGGICDSDADVCSVGQPVDPAVMKDSEIRNLGLDITQYQAIVLGTPCNNMYTAQFLGFEYPSCNSPLGLEPGEGRISLRRNGPNYALIVTGEDECGIRKAGKVLKYSPQFALRGETVFVR